jgi:hypothetical protein
MNPSSISDNSPSPLPLGDLPEIQVIDQGQTCRFCGAPVKTLVSAFGSFTKPCRECGHRSTDLVSWWIVDKRIRWVASPQFSCIEQVQQFADIFAIRPEDDYRIQKFTFFYSTEGYPEERAKHMALLEWNAKLIAWLKEQKPVCGEDPDALILLAYSAKLTGYSLPQFRETAKGA